MAYQGYRARLVVLSWVGAQFAPPSFRRVDRRGATGIRDEISQGAGRAEVAALLRAVTTAAVLEHLGCQQVADDMKLLSPPATNTSFSSADTNSECSNYRTINSARCAIRTAKTQRSSPSRTFSFH